MDDKTDFIFERIVRFIEKSDEPYKDYDIYNDDGKIILLV